MNILVLGLGNILLSDEAVGVLAVEEIKRRYSFSPEIDIIDGGTKGLDLLPFLEGRDRVLIIDAVDFDKEPGYIGILENKEIPAVLHSKLSVHHIGLGEVLLALEMLGIKPQEICLIGIQPLTLETGIGLSPVLASKIDELIKRVIEKLNIWGVKCKERSSDVSCSALKDNP